MHRPVSSAFIVDVQSNLEPDPNETVAAYMCILIHVVNDSLFPDADLNSITWTGPPAEIITIQSLLYASIVTSLFAAFLAMVGSGGSTDISGTVRVPLPTRATTDGGSRMDSRSGTSSPSLKSFRQCSRLYCRCQGSPYHRATGPSAAPSAGSSVHSRFRSHLIRTLHIRCSPPLRLPLSDTRHTAAPSYPRLFILNNFLAASAFGISSNLKVLVVILSPYPPSSQSSDSMYGYFPGEGLVNRRVAVEATKNLAESKIRGTRDRKSGRDIPTLLGALVSRFPIGVNSSPQMMVNASRSSDETNRLSDIELVDQMRQAISLPSARATPEY